MSQRGMPHAGAMARAIRRVVSAGATRRRGAVAACSRPDGNLHGGRHWPRGGFAIVAAALIVLGLAACGGEPSASGAAPSAGATAVSPSASAAPGGSPLAGSSIDAAAEWFDLYAGGRPALAASMTAGYAQKTRSAIQGIARARLLRIDQDTATKDGTRELQVQVYIRPVDGPTPWDGPGEYTLFVTLVKVQGGWLVDAVATSP